MRLLFWGTALFVLVPPKACVDWCSIATTATSSATKPRS